MRWRVPRMWEGQTVVVLASGESLTQAVADRVRGMTAIAVNTTFQRAPWADMIFSADARWWNCYWTQVEALDALKVTLEPVRRALLLKNTGLNGFDPDPGCVRTGGNSGYAAVHVAAHAGARRIVLCGFDMRGGHWHGAHPATLRNAGDGVFDAWLKRFVDLKAALDERGIEVVNCTPGSALVIFPFDELENVIETSSLPAA